MTLLTIREPHSLILAIDRIHDCWFDIDRIKYDASARMISIPFWSGFTQRPPINQATREAKAFDDLLVVHDAEEPKIEDREEIGNYTFNDIVIRGNQLAIRADPHVRISCVVGSLHITLGDDAPEPS